MRILRCAALGGKTLCLWAAIDWKIYCGSMAAAFHRHSRMLRPRFTNSWNYIASTDLHARDTRAGVATLGGKLYAVGGRYDMGPTSEFQQVHSILGKSTILMNPSGWSGRIQMIQLEDFETAAWECSIRGQDLYSRYAACTWDAR